MIGYSLVDIGANLTHPCFNHDLEQVLDRAKEAGVSKIMVTGTTVKLSEDARDLARKHPNFLYYTAGVHPHDAKEFTDDTMKSLRDLCSQPDCVAVGECGLDFNRNFSTPDQQREAFDQQLRLACELKKPLFIHERDAHSDMIAALSKYKDHLPNTVIHCFTGTAAEAEAYIKFGCYIGLTGYLWKDRSENGVKFALLNRLIPLERLLLETDAPFMYPKLSFKKIPKEWLDRISKEALKMHNFASFQRNEPCSLAAICEFIAAIMNEQPCVVAKHTTENAKLVYSLD